MLNSKERAYLRGLASKLPDSFHIGKSGLTPELTAAVTQMLEANELIKIAVLKNCGEDKDFAAEALADRTRSQLVQRIGSKIVLYKPGKKPRIDLKDA